MAQDIRGLRDELFREILQSSMKRVAILFTASKALVLISTWGQWRTTAALTGLFVVGFVFNVPVMNALLRRSKDLERTEALRLPVNLPLFVATGWLAQWNFSVWIYFMINLVVTAIVGTHAAQRREVLVWVLLAPCAIALGASPLVVASASLGVYATWSLAKDLFRTLTRTLEDREAQRWELEKAHDRLTQLHKAIVQQEKLAGLGMLAAGIAHEINNPMAYVTSNVSTLHEDLQAMDNLTPPLQEYVDDVLPATLDGIQRVNAIVADLRRFARGDPEGSQEYDLNEGVEHALRIAQGQLKHRCQVERSLGALPKLRGRSQQMVQVFVNLFVNAAQAMKDGGTLRVGTRLEDGEAVVAVEDTGIGMDETTREQLFQPFFTTKPQGEGTGLGLAVVHGIVTSHGGRIEVQSAPGRGSTFVIRLPVPHQDRAIPAAA